MNLTKRLYRLDEVRAALLFCLMNRRIMESIFWLKELEDSFYTGEARRLLLVSWVMNIGLSRIICIYEWSKLSMTREGRLRLCWQLARCSERDSSLWYLLCSGVVPIKYGTSTIIDSWISICDLDSFWTSIPDNPCLESLKTNMKNYDIFARVAAFSLSCKTSSSSMAPLSSEEPVDLRKTLDEWDNLTIRKGRVYEIPRFCLYGMTMRGLGEDSTDEINAFNMSDSPYWRKVIEFYTINNVWISDDMKEEFFSKHFPEDIPDEWSLPEKRMSHGPGVYHVGNLFKWWASWVNEKHDWIWGDSIYNINKWMKEQPSNTDASCIDKICRLYSERAHVTIPKWRKVWEFNNN